MTDRKLRILSFILACAVCLALVMIAAYIGSAALGEETGYEEAWVICHPESWVNARIKPKGRSEITAYVPPMTKLSLDGKAKNRYLHAVDMACEDPEGWISAGFIVYSEPRKDGHVYPIRTTTRVAARSGINGKIRHWLYDWDTVTVYIVSDEWSVTNYGFVKTEFIELVTPMDIPVEMTDPSEMTWEEDTEAVYDG